MSRNELIFGIHTVLSAIRNAPGEVLELWVDDSRRDRRIEELIKTAADAGLGVNFASGKTLRRLAGRERHQGVVARYRSKQALGDDDLPSLLAAAGDQPPLLLILDGVTDPQNLGACIRTAEAAAVDAVIAPEYRAVGITPVVRRVALGSVDRVPFVAVKNLARTMRYLKTQAIWLYGTDHKAESCYYELAFDRPMALLMGAEGRGLRRLTRELCDDIAYLPMAGRAESLNVSVATGICLYEVVRQRIGTHNCGE